MDDSEQEEEPGSDLEQDDDDDEQETEMMENVEEEEKDAEPSPPPRQPTKIMRTAAKGRARKPVPEAPTPAVTDVARPIITPCRARPSKAPATNPKPAPTTRDTNPATPKKAIKAQDGSADKPRAAPRKTKIPSPASDFAKPVPTSPAQCSSPALHRVSGKKSPDPKDELIRKLYAETGPILWDCVIL